MKPLLLFFWCSFLTAFSYGQDYERGIVIDSIAVKNGEANEHFALYLPPAYNPDELAAVVFVFDPLGRGAFGLAKFVKAAAHYNYILIASNNTKNGPYEDNFTYANRLFEQVFATFKIDERQIYTAGFSGGSRLACTIAVLTKAIQGVIACGAGYSLNDGHIPGFEDHFSYVGLVGDEDMNYQEMQRVDRWFEQFEIDHEILTYADGHAWPPEKQLMRAFSWLELQAYRRDIREKNASKIDHSYRDQLMLFDSLRQQGNALDAYKTFERISRNYKTYYDLDSLAVVAEPLKKTKTYKKQSTTAVKIEKLEKEFSRKFRERFAEELASKKTDQEFRWWKKEIAKLDKSYVNTEDLQLQKMGKRLRYQLFAMAYETSQNFRRNGKFEEALYCDQLLVVQRPEQAFPYYRLAQTHALRGEVNQLAEMLEKAIELGFTDLPRLRATKEFQPFLKHEALKRLLEN